MPLKKNTDRKKFVRRNQRIVLIFFAVCICTVVSYTALIYFYNTSSTAIRGVSINQINLYKLNRNEARTMLQNITDSFLYQKTQIRINEQSYEYTTKDMGIQIDIEATLENASQYGRDTSFINNFVTQAKTSLSSKRAPLVPIIDQARFDAFIATHVAQFEKQPKDAGILYDTEKSEFKLIPEERGITIDKEAFKEKLLNNALYLSNDTILLAKIKAEPSITTSQLSPIQKEATRILNAGFEIKINNISQKIPRDTLASWINITPDSPTITLNQDTIEQYITTHHSPEITKKPVNSRYIITENGKLREAREGETGYVLDVTESAKSIMRSLENKGVIAILSIKPIHPDISQDTAQALETLTLIGSGESQFLYSPENRIHNIKLGASKYQGIVIPPGAEFSFNEYLGRVTEAEGWLPSYVIENGEVVMGYGGGLCQVSTTLFRAALNAGLEITERRGHSYVIEYYGEPGLDATIYPPLLDLKFRNNTENYIVLQNNIEGSNITFQIYGTDDGRTVQVTKPTHRDAQEDGSIKSYVTQTVRDANGTIIHTKIFQSIYGPKKEAVNTNPFE